MPGPLYGKRILLTRERAPSTIMARDIQALGGIPVILPVMKIAPTELTHEEKDTITHIRNFEWIIFTSPNGVRSFMQHVKILGGDLSYTKIAAVGEKTAEVIQEFGLTVERIPDQYTAENLADSFIKSERKGTSLLLALGQLAKPQLEKQLHNAGFLTKRINVYQTVINDEVQEELYQLINENPIDVVTFASPSAIDFFLKMTSGMDLEDFWNRTIVACIGNVSANFARSKGIHPRIVPETFTAQGLVEAIAEFYSVS